MDVGNLLILKSLGGDKLQCRGCQLTETGNCYCLDQCECGTVILPTRKSNHKNKIAVGMKIIVASLVHITFLLSMSLINIFAAHLQSDHQYY